MNELFQKIPETVGQDRYTKVVLLLGLPTGYHDFSNDLQTARKATLGLKSSVPLSTITSAACSYCFVPSGSYSVIYVIDRQN